ncbi:MULTISPECIES: sulfotransferase [unclassified Guyparkeria]|uniref:sulfotransferase n=1 Tax=unclassified Guyparkeria TaxID=2626246 RepID=UPI000733667E|nr:MULTISPECIES: sulfotransferase [unclassified Guyparkeria]KTG16292.1 hypothetical protein AUR63_05555 [Guyparkeria sp. XI15]OAE85143.1 hypothetical protein AWR35_05565 [Guyparkeria sp. WRN-7]
MDPVIFVGMHRSGTSLVGRLLEELGLFVGKGKDENNEAIFFQALNSWLLAQCGSRWDNPGQIGELWQHEQAMELIEDYVRFMMASPRAIDFLGVRGYLLNRSIMNHRHPWGWKDPRNTFTLPLWLRLFPRAKVVCIERHGVDVAQSLVTREAHSEVRARGKYRRYKYLTWIRPKRGGFMESARCATLDGAFSLWQEYQAEVDRLADKVPADRIVRVRYESLLAAPETSLRKLADFCGLAAEPEAVEKACRGVNAGRAFAYAADPELVAFARSKADVLAACGYSLASARGGGLRDENS